MLPQTVADIPRQIHGVDSVEILVIDDGSTDRTGDVAREIGVDHIVSNKNNRGLARTFRTGIDACLRLGADIIVNTDADNQYQGADIPKLVAPILKGKADIVVGDRQTEKIEHFSLTKKMMQAWGSKVVRNLSGTRVQDTVSGFRALSREAALQLNIISPFSYTIEMTIQAGKKHMAISSVPVKVNPKTRESRLFRDLPTFVTQSIITMVRMYTMFQPLRVFFCIGTILLIIGLVPIIRFVYFYAVGMGEGHIQSLILGGVFFMMGFISFLVGLVADVVSFNRQLIDMTLEKVRKIELKRMNEPT